MKKRLLCVLVLVLMITLTACGGGGPKGEVTDDITWDELLAANTIDAVLAQTDGFSATIEDENDDTYISYVAMVDGKLISSSGSPGYTEDLIDGIRYKASEDGMGKSITIMAPTADLKEVVEGAYGEEVSLYQAPGKIYANESQYFAALYHEDAEWGIVTEGYAYFDATTLLLDRIDLVQKLGKYEIKQSVQMAYGITDFPVVSYDRIVNAEDTVDVTIHYPDGITKDITVDRDVDVIAYYPNHEEIWSACPDVACTGSVDDLGWITGSHGDLHLCEGDVPSAPPALSSVLKNSTFEEMFKDNYDTYFQTIDVMDAEQNMLQMRELAWYVDPEVGLCLNFEVKDDNYEIVQSGRARDNGWYTWSADTGYAVDFYDQFSYAENLIKDDRLFLYEEQLGAPMMQDGENLPYYIPYAETVKGGMVNEYQYHIHSDTDYIERVEITHKDNAGNIVGYETCYIGGNGPIPGDMDIFVAISAPEDTEAIALTVVTPNGEKTYSVRNDAAISWKGGALYSDANRTTAVTDLTWVDGSEATVYVK